MARRSLKPQLNQIRTWVRQGRTDAWIAHQLEATVQQIAAFKDENDLSLGSDPVADGAATPEFNDEVDLRAEDDAKIAAELEAEAARREAEEAEEAARRAEAGDEDEDEDEDDGEVENDDEHDDDGAAPRRRRGRRGGRGRSRRKAPAFYEAAFDHGDEGYGLWLDPSVADNPLYAEHWSGKREIEVTIEADQIIIRRAGEAADSAAQD